MTRNSIALTICTLSAAFAASLCLVWHRDTALTLFQLCATWAIISEWLAKRLWLLHLGGKELLREAQRGSLHLSGLALQIERGALVLFLAAGVCLLV